MPFLQWATGVLPWPALRHMRAISDSVYSISQQVLRRKKEMLKHGGDSLAREVGEGKDLMSVLCESLCLGLLGEQSLMERLQCNRTCSLVRTQCPRMT